MRTLKGVSGGTATLEPLRNFRDSLPRIQFQRIPPENRIGGQVTDWLNRIGQAWDAGPKAEEAAPSSPRS